jgi:hypothetical protein
MDETNRDLTNQESSDMIDSTAAEQQPDPISSTNLEDGDTLVEFTAKPDSFYYLNTANGQLIYEDQDLPRRKTNIIMLLNREFLLFNELAFQSKKKLKTAEIKALQSNYIPYSGQHLNLIYSFGKKKKQRFYYWLSPETLEEKELVYDEVPESLVFKGDPKLIKHYNMFIFRRLTGFEIIYFDNELFYSVFEKEEDNVAGKLVLLARKFSNRSQIKILSELPIDPLLTGYDLKIIDGTAPYYFLPHYLHFPKIFSNISQNKEIKSYKSMVNLGSRYMTVFLIFSLLTLLFNLGFHVFLQINHRTYQKEYDTLAVTMENMNMLEQNVQMIENKINAYPNHLAYLQHISEAMDDDTYFTSYSLKENTIIISVISPSSADLEKKLQQKQDFATVEITSRVNTSETNKESFEMKLTLRNHAS